MIVGGVNFDTYFNNYPDKEGYFGKYGGVFIDEKLKHALEVNQSITCFNGSFDLFFGYKVDSVDVDLINHNVTVVLHEDDFFDQMVKLLTIMQELY